jgi:hypothetical protein
MRVFPSAATSPIRARRPCGDSFDSTSAFVMVLSEELRTAEAVVMKNRQGMQGRLNALGAAEPHELDAGLVRHRDVPRAGCRRCRLSRKTSSR